MIAGTNQDFGPQAILRASAFFMAEHGRPASFEAMESSGLVAEALQEKFRTVGQLVRAIFEDYLDPRTGPLIAALHAPSLLAEAIAPFWQGDADASRLIAPFLQGSMEARGLFGNRRQLIRPMLLALRNEAGLASAPDYRARPGEAEIAIALLADLALLAGATQTFRSQASAQSAAVSEASVAFVVASAATALLTAQPAANPSRPA